MRTKRVVLIAAVAVMTMATSFILISALASAQQRSPTATWTLEGQVFRGVVGDETHPLAGVTVSVYSANNPYPDPGTFILSTTTSITGWYGLTIDDTGVEFLHIRETDPAGHTSVGARSVSGTVRTSNWIEYAIPLGGKVLIGNNFWDQSLTLGWAKWVNDVPWDPGLRVTAETSDTIQITDVITTLTFEPLELAEVWNPAHLALRDYWIEPPVGNPVTATGKLVWQLPEGGQVFTITKLFHVESCTWTTTILSETLSAGAASEERLVSIAKESPLLWIDSWYDSEVYPGEVATFTLSYGNNGGFESGAWIQNDFPPETPFVWSIPPATDVAQDRLWARWDIGDLARDDSGEIMVGVVVTEGVPTSTTIEIWDWIYDHADQEWASTVVTFHVQAPPPVDWTKWVNGAEWEPELVVTAQTSDTITIVDVFSTSQRFDLVEEWDPALQLISFRTDPPFGTITTGTGSLMWEVPAGGPQVVTITKLFHVEPCNWEVTLLREFLVVAGGPEPLARFVPVEKWQPGLWIESVYDPVVFVGEPAIFTLHYGNNGGREFGAWIRNEFPDIAPFVESVPPPTRVDSDGLWAEWDIEVLETGQPGSITVTVGIVPRLPPSTTIEIWDGIFNHAGELVGETFTFFHIPPPPVTFPEGDWPWYAQEEISVDPEPPIAGAPTHLCAEVVNHDPNHPHTVTLEFSVANFGIGVPFTPVGATDLVVPPGSSARGCVIWVPPTPDHWCIQVRIVGERFPHMISQRNVDVDEPLAPDTPHSRSFAVGNPFDHPVTITLGLVHHLPDWGLELSTHVLPNMAPGMTRPVTLTVTPPGVMPPDGHPIVDVEAYVEDVLIGGFRKIFRPPVILHRFPDPPYAEREISVHPYPPLAGEPTEVCVELRNPTPVSRTVWVQFSWASFGIGIPFTPIDGLREVHLPPYSVVNKCIHWIPPVSGHVCLQVELFMEGHEPQRSQRNIDVYEPLEPGKPHTLSFPVGNPFDHPVTITLGLIRHLPDWEISLSEDVLSNVGVDDRPVVSLTVQPPPGVPLPPDDTPVVDVEAYVEGHLIGGFRKIHRPPVPLHPFPDPPYAEREITVHPYPPLAGEPTEVCVELYNPTPWPQDVEVQFSWANFGIGIPFTPINGPRVVHLPPFSVVRECIHWIPPVSGHVCSQVELFIDGYEPQRSQRNIDVYEPLRPDVPHTLPFPVGNPFDHPMTITLGLVHHLPDWEISLSEDVLPNVPPGELREVFLTVIPPPDQPLPPDGHPIVDVEAFAEGRLIGGFRKIHRPPIPLHPFPDPFYAEREISVHPYPPLADEPTEVCVELRNPTPDPHTVWVQFSWANLGIGIPFTPIDGLREVHLPPYSIVNECIHWIPPVSGHMCLQVELFMEGHERQRSQRNIDVDEPLVPNESHSRLFPVGNPFTEPVTITLGLVRHLDGWDVRLVPDVLPGMPPGHVEEVLLTVTPPDELPPDEHPVVDVEAFVEGELIGGFRKIFRPEVPVHIPGDPVYAEREIFVHPYPPRAHEPTELIVELRNPTDESQTVEVLFSVAPFGIGLPFEPVNEPILVGIPSHGMVRADTIWLPPEGGLWCIQVEIFVPGHDEPFWSRLNLDVGEPLRPLVPHSRPFPVGNPFNHPVSITLGLIPHFPDWGLELSETELLDMQPGEVRNVILTVTPPEDLPADGDPIVDVEAFVEGELLGGFRKIFRPDVSVHRPKDPPYAESEIFIDPYPVFPGAPTKLGVEVFNPTNQDRVVTATFSVAPFGIGLPFTTSHILPNPVRIFVPRHGAARGHTFWTPPPSLHGKVCVRVMLEMEGHDPVWSHRNIDVGEPLRPGVPHSLVFPVGSWPYTEPVSITLGLVKHMEMWDVSLTPPTLTNVQPGQELMATLTVTPPDPGTGEPVLLGSREPIVDVEAYVEGELLGGFRKLDEPRVPLDKLHEKGYAESEISIVPYPPRLGQDSRVSTVVYNTSPDTVTVNLEFGWAKFGMGIPFSTTGMNPITRAVTLNPGVTTTASVTWTPALPGPQCIRVLLSDPGGLYEPQESMRNVNVVERPSCGESRSFYVTVYNGTPFTQTVDVGTITFDVPADWVVTTVPSDTLELGPFGEGVITVTVLIPCSGALQLTRALEEIYALQGQAGGVPTIDVEGYIDGELVGGIEIQLIEAKEVEFTIYLPVILKDG